LTTASVIGMSDHWRELWPASVFLGRKFVVVPAKSTGGEAGRPWHPSLS
jgi:hypothetical protein